MEGGYVIGSMEQPAVPPPTLAQAIGAIKAGQRGEGRALLAQVLAADPNNVTAWLWLSEVADSDDERREYLKRVLAIDPDNPEALKGLELLGTIDRIPPWLSETTPLVAERSIAPVQEVIVTPAPPPAETVYYFDNLVQITSTRAMFGETTYAVANITAVEMAVQPASRIFGSIVIAMGAFAILLGLRILTDNPIVILSVMIIALIGLLIIIAGVWLNSLARPSYLVRITTPGDVKDMLESRSPEYIQRIVDAINEAIVKRG